MKLKHQTLVLALLAAALALPGCKSWHRHSDATGSSGTSGSTSSSGEAGKSWESGDSQASTLHKGQGAGQQAQHGAPSQMAPNSTVLAIEQAASKLDSDTSMGETGSAGITGSSGQSYRITLRLDDGSTQVIHYPTTPDFRSGDRVHVANGAIVR